MDWAEASALLANAQRVLVLTHIGPDGDAIGSLCGLASALRGMGKQVTMAVDEGVPPDLRFIPGAGEVHAALDKVDVDLCIAVDCGDVRRMGEVGRVAQLTGRPLINLDHHPTNTFFGDTNLVDPSTVAAAEGVLNWLDYMQVELDETTAFCLLTGMVTDTLCFRTDNVTPRTLAKAQRLMELGAPLSEIVQRTVNRKTYAGLRLWQAAIPGVQLEEHVIWATITREMFEQSGFEGTDDDGLVSMLVQVEEAYISAVFREKPDGKVEIGFRAVPGFDTSAVAVLLGGGGHRLASGATVDEPLETLVPRVVALLKEAVRAGAPVVV